ncbi:hypothetical protein B9Z19DRAFT_688006 [Tuber borchii]|uniref:Uncharacterized protein n=1 Tax=Tuber borchii TaxID=42251 RepID=A0A2T6ZA47_TUBBO|nr:hypothetical protein B9Z19DRAFT_688006 [Tuber borchii]
MRRREIGRFVSWSWAKYCSTSHMAPSSAGVLGKDRAKHKPDGDRDSNDTRNPPGGKDKRRVAPTTATKPTTIFAKVLFQWSSIIQKGKSGTILLVTPPRMLLYYFNPTANLRGISIRRIHSCDGQQAELQNITSRRDGGLSREY